MGILLLRVGEETSVLENGVEDAGRDDEECDGCTERDRWHEPYGEVREEPPRGEGDS